MQSTRNEKPAPLVDGTAVDRSGIDPFLGGSEPIRELQRMAHKALLTDSPILIRGETGTGKGVLASWLHHNGAHARAPFIDLNCAGLSKELMESELFGHERGAFTGAVAAKPGLFEAAHGGTLFLDEIGDVDLHVQPKLLKALEEKRFHRLGDVHARRVEVRFIAATQLDLGRMVREQQFRRDLYFRISTLQLHVPSLRDRAEDVPILTRWLLLGITERLRRPPLGVSATALEALTNYPWTGNIRELKNVLERAVLLCERDGLELGDLRFDLPPPSAPAGSGDSRLTLLELERCHIERVLHEERGHVDLAAARLGVPRSSLYQKLKLHRITVSRS
jgi:transcriptional regulator with PAS, ATPase and Fis domain